MATYVPRVLLCGDVEAFQKKIGNRPVEVVGRIDFKEKNFTAEDIKNLLEGAAEYLIFTDDLELYDYLKKFPKHWQVMSAEGFAKINSDGFFSIEMHHHIGNLLYQKKISGRVLDFDCSFGKSNFHTRGDLEVELDCLAENLYPIYENVYGKIYRCFDEFKFHHFDAMILNKERSPEEFIDVLIETDALTEKIFAFVRKNSALEKFLAANENIFAAIEKFETANGAWCLIKKFSPVDLKIYVVTHKDAKLSTLPEGYKFIHAGKALAKNNFGYAGDDTGDNISRLNPFLDEVTALYWIWKNTTHTHTGFVHYRRFFTSDTNQKTFDAEKILSAKEILSILRDYDVIAPYEGFTDRTQREMMIFSTGQPDLVRVAEKIIRAHLARTHPDYLDAFDDVINGFTLFACGIHITRRNIFNAYCEWLFSFIIDATKEIRDKIEILGTPLEEMGHAYSRIAGFFCERLFTVWLIKNHLRIKMLPIMQRKDV